MLVSVSTNPSIDRTIYVPHLTPHTVHRSTQLHLTAGGKAINAARAAARLGLHGTIAGFLAGYAGQHLADLVKDENLDAVWHRISQGETKMSHLFYHDSGDSTVVNEPGPQLTREDWLGFTDLVCRTAYGKKAALLAGSIPPGVTAQDYFDFCTELKSIVSHVFIDTPGKSLEIIVNNPKGFSLKVNRHELGEAMNQNLESPWQINNALRCLIGAGAKLAGVTMGKQGAILADINHTFMAEPVNEKAVSSVGSGDSFTAGLIFGILNCYTLEKSLKLASACGCANAETLFPAQFDLDCLNQIYSQINVIPM